MITQLSVEWNDKYVKFRYLLYVLSFPIYVHYSKSSFELCMHISLDSVGIKKIHDTFYAIVLCVQEVKIPLEKSIYNKGYH